MGGGRKENEGEEKEGWENKNKCASVSRRLRRAVMRCWISAHNPLIAVDRRTARCYKVAT